MNTETDNTELATLRSHNTDLLAELRSAKTDRKRLTDELDAMTGERNTAAAEVRRFKLGLPLAALLQDVAVPGMQDVWLAEFNRAGFAFDLDGDAPVVRDAEGNTPTVQGPRDEEPRPVGFNYADLALLVCGPDGVAPDKRTPSQRAFASLTIGSLASGAGGGPSTNNANSYRTPEAKPTAPAHKFGLQ